MFSTHRQVIMWDWRKGCAHDYSAAKQVGIRPVSENRTILWCTTDYGYGAVFATGHIEKSTQSREEREAMNLMTKERRRDGCGSGRPVAAVIRWSMDWFPFPSIQPSIHLLPFIWARIANFLCKYNIQYGINSIEWPWLVSKCYLLTEIHNWISNNTSSTSIEKSNNIKPNPIIESNC